MPEEHGVGGSIPSRPTKKMRMLHNKSLKDQYYEEVLSRLLIDRNNLTETETDLIEIGYEMVVGHIEDKKELENEIRRLRIENANLKSYQDDRDYPED